jgi:hypothetical protein
VLLMLLTCCTAASIKTNRTDWLSCTPSALLLILRPTYGLIVLAALICLGARKWAMRVSMITALLFLVTLHFGGVKRWMRFLQVIHETEVRFLEEAVNTGTSNYSTPPVKQPVDVIGKVDYRKGLSPYSISGTLTGLYKSRSLSLCSIISPKWIELLNSLCMLLMFVGGLWIAFVARSRGVSPNILLAYMLLWPMIFEFFSPERYLYTAVIEIVPLVVVVFDEDIHCSMTSNNVQFYALTSLLALGVLVPISYQFVHNVKLIAYVVSALLLFAIPLCTFGYCVYCIATSSATANT